MQENQYIFFNTIITNIKTIIIVFISFLSSRYLLKALGVDGFGLYNLILGISITLEFVITGLTTTTSRFTILALGKNDTEYSRLVHNTIIIANKKILFWFIFILQTFGIVMIFWILKIPEGKLITAFVIFEMSVLDSYYKIKVIPYNSLLIAKENFLFINIVILSAAFLRLGFILLLFVLPFDRLIFYSVIMFIISFMSRQITVIYVSKKYSESKVNHKIYYNQDLFKEILSFLKFSWIGQISNIIKKQGTNFLLNIFSGNVLLNAAYAAAGQVASISDMAFSPISQAIMPQALKSYSGNNKPRFKKLTLLNCKLAIILSWIFIIPLLFESDFILHIWLKEVPVFTSQFMILILIDEMIRQLSNGLVISNVVSEKVKVVYLANMFIQILSFILSFIFLKCGMKFWIIFYANIAVSIIFLFINLIFSNKYIYINALLYFFRVVIPSAVIGTCIILLMNLFKTYLSFSSPINSLLIMALSFLLSFILFFVSLFNKEESQKIISITKGTLKNLYTKR